MNDTEALEMIVEAQGDRAEPATEAPPIGTPQSRVAQMWDHTTDYGQLIRDKLPDPTFLPTPTLGDGLVYENALSLVCGHRKHGKSHVATLIALDAINAGRHAIIMDYENGAPRIARRLRDLGASTKKLSQLMRGYTFPKIADPKGMLLFLEDVATVYPGTVVLVDAFRGYGTKVGSAVRGGFNPNDTTHIEQVLAPLAEVSKQAELSIIVIDHPNRTTTSDSVYKASNSAAKEQIADAIYWVNKHDDYSVHQQGAISIKPDNDRDGLLPLEPLYFQVGGQGTGKKFFIKPCGAQDVGNAARIADEIIEQLNTAPMNKSELRQVIQGSNEEIGKAVSELHAQSKINYDPKAKKFFGGKFKGAKL